MSIGQKVLFGACTVRNYHPVHFRVMCSAVADLVRGLQHAVEKRVSDGGGGNGAVSEQTAAEITGSVDTRRGGINMAGAYLILQRRVVLLHMRRNKENKPKVLKM